MSHAAKIAQHADERAAGNARVALGRAFFQAAGAADHGIVFLEHQLKQTGRRETFHLSVIPAVAGITRPGAKAIAVETTAAPEEW
jgi:hypothetical protein